MRVSVRSEAGPIAVEGVRDQDGPKILAGGQTDVVEGDNISVREAKPEELKVPAPTDDVWDPSNRPNGPMTAGIAPKMPKSGGETAQVVDEGLKAVVERPVAELGRATQAGGPDAEEGLKTPGPQPDNTTVAAAPQVGAQATGPTGSERAAPGPRSDAGKASLAATGTKSSAKGSKGTRAAKSASRSRGR